MKCPSCSARLGCVESKPLDSGGTRRKYKCADCGGKFTTFEQLLEHIGAPVGTIIGRTKAPKQRSEVKRTAPTTLRPAIRKIRRRVEDFQLGHQDVEDPLYDIQPDIEGLIPHERHHLAHD